MVVQSTLAFVAKDGTSHMDVNPRSKSHSVYVHVETWQSTQGDVENEV